MKRTFVALWSMTKYCDLRKSFAPERQVRIAEGAASPRGIGYATAALFAEHRAKVVVARRDAKSKGVQPGELIGDDGRPIERGVFNWKWVNGLVRRLNRFEANTSDTSVTGPTAVRDSKPRNQSGMNVNDRACVAAKRSVVECASITALAGRRPHQALAALHTALMSQRVSWALASPGTRATRASRSCAAVRNHSPAGVSLSGWLRRSNNSAPSHSSSARMRRLKAGCVMCRSSAAREKLPLAASAKKSSSHDRVIDICGRCFHGIKGEKNSIGAADKSSRSFAPSSTTHPRQA